MEKWGLAANTFRNFKGGASEVAIAGSRSPRLPIPHLSARVPMVNLHQTGAYSNGA